MTEYKMEKAAEEAREIQELAGGPRARKEDYQAAAELIDEARQKELGIISEPAMRKFIENRRIEEDDFELLGRLGGFNKDLIILNLHNFFSSNKDHSARELRALIERASAPETKSLYEIFLQFCQKYGWEVCWHLVSVLEKRRK